MKEICAIIRRDKLPETKAALADIGFPSLTIQSVEGRGKQKGDVACSLADIQIISFGPGKALSLGEGGALLTRHRRIYERGVAISQHPERSRNEGLTELPEHPFLNARMHQVSAILGCALLARDKGEK